MPLNLFLLALVCLVLVPHTRSLVLNEITEEVVLYPSNLKVKRGSKSSQPLTVLQTNQLTGTQDVWDTYIELKPNNKKHDSRFGFSIPPELDDTDTQISAFKLQANIRGPIQNVQKWKFLIRNYNTKKWESIFANKKDEAFSWVWYIREKHVSVSTFRDQYVHSKSGMAAIRIISNNKKDDLNLDYLALALIIKTSPPAPEPTLSPILGSTLEPTPTTKPELLSTGDTWTYDIGGYIGAPYSTKVVMIDLFETSTSTITQLKNQDKVVCCYFSAGTWEEWRNDANEFPSSIIGNDMDDWEGEKWIDVRSEETMDIMKKRMDLALERGCQALEPDNVDAYTYNKADTGFDLTRSDQILFLTELSIYAKKLGLLIGLKNAPDLVDDMEALYDFSIAEECYRYDECCKYSSFVNSGKPVFAIEYRSKKESICNKFEEELFSLIFGNYAVSKLYFCDSSRRKLDHVALDYAHTNQTGVLPLAGSIQKQRMLGSW
eukprot:CAMPEP_0194377900 /NCGR_PEP_ID=MMETSP0174-20130528/32936_1 /TAXON_ID=216777 /ORGANISM="Proboscia alata, Strain PI-D3" /LENGTH=489 /DNA_ID=CAMNT_0039159553 /DNA_START=76 /DNA_END=1542 /DNA_ORIENTATION=+